MQMHAAWFQERTVEHAWSNWSLPQIAPARHDRHRQRSIRNFSALRALNTALPHLQRSRLPRSRQPTDGNVGSLRVYVVCCMLYVACVVALPCVVHVVYARTCVLCLYVGGVVYVVAVVVV